MIEKGKEANLSSDCHENTESSVEWDSGQFGAEAADDNSTADALGFSFRSQSSCRIKS